MYGGSKIHRCIWNARKFWWGIYPLAARVQRVVLCMTERFGVKQASRGSKLFFLCKFAHCNFMLVNIISKQIWSSNVTEICLLGMVLRPDFSINQPTSGQFSIQCHASCVCPIKFMQICEKRCSLSLYCILACMRRLLDKVFASTLTLHKVYRVIHILDATAWPLSVGSKWILKRTAIPRAHSFKACPHRVLVNTSSRFWPWRSTLFSWTFASSPKNVPEPTHLQGAQFPANY